MLRVVLSTAVAGVLIAAAVPDIQKVLTRRDAAPAAAVAGGQESRSGGARLGDMVIRADADGHFRIAGRVRGTPMRFLADTGATTVALRASEAARAGVRPSRADYTVPVITANGQVMGARAVLDAVEVGPIRIAQVEALVLPDEALSGNLLGMSFLKRLGRFEVADGRMVLSP